MKKAEVYFARLKDPAGLADQVRAVKSSLAASGFPGRLGKRDMTAIKVHVGEKNNDTHVRPELAAAAVQAVKKAGALPFITDTATLYKGQRDNGIRHALHAHAHGFGLENTGAPFIPVDGLAGNHEAEVEVNGELHKTVKVAGEIIRADALLVVSHPTGHMGSGLGAAIKNVGMGLASRAGKMRQHSTITPEVASDKCTDCGKCRKWCPTDAIEEREGVSFILREKCIGCGECIAVCRFDAVKFNYGTGSDFLQKSMVEHAAGVLRRFGGKAVFINVMVNMTKECDCLNRKQAKFIPDLGVLASEDIVAVDQATLDLTREAHGQDLSRMSFLRLDPQTQIRHAEKLGLGNSSHQLIEL